MRRIIHHIILIIFTITAALPLRAENAVDDYDALSRLSSEQLLDSGRTYFEQRVASRALACFSIVSERYRKGMPAAEAQLSIRALNNNGCVYKYFYFNYIDAYECFSQALDLCEETGYEDFKPVVLVNLGDLLSDYSSNFVSQPMAQQARQIFDQCMDDAVARRNWEVMTTAFFNLANQNYDLDLTKYRVIFADDIPASTPDLEYVRLQYTGISHIQQRRYAEARDCFRRQLAVVTTPWEPERDTLATLMSIAYTYQCEHDYQHMAEALLQAYDLASARNVDDHAAGICQQLADCYHLMGDAPRQQLYYQRYLESKEATHGSHLANIGELNYIHELQKEQLKARELTLRQQRQRYALVGAALILAVVLISAFLLWRKNRELTARNKSLFEKTQQVMKAEAEEQKLRRSRQSDENRESLTLRIQAVLDQPDVYCQQDFTVARLAKLVESNTTYVSQAINDHYATSFSNVLGQCRVREACRRMNDREHFGNITIEGIAAGVGFKSRTAFANAFKREVGLTPSEYLRMAAQQPQETPVS